MRRGDVLFWGPGGSQHVAIYLGNGMYTYSRGTKPFNAADYANWYFNAPGTSRIVRAEFSYVKHEPQTTGGTVEFRTRELRRRETSKRASTPMRA